MLPWKPYRSSRACRASGPGSPELSSISYVRCAAATGCECSHPQPGRHQTHCPGRRRAHRSLHRQSLPFGTTCEKSAQASAHTPPNSSQRSVYVWIFDFTPLFSLLLCHSSVQQFKRHPADFGVPAALRKRSFPKWSIFVPFTAT